MIKVGIVGGTGYTGVELLRLLAMHPDVDLQVITSRSEAGTLVSDTYPNLRGRLDLPFTEPDVNKLAACDLVFFATPNGVAMKQVPELLSKGVRVIDLAADFRISDVAVWEKWYGQSHACSELLKQAVYGLPEINRSEIKHCQLLANPGCYPTAVQLGFLPLLENNLIETSHLIADAKSGISGAGRGANVGSLFSETSGSFKAYGASGHRHLPEIKQGLNAMQGGDVGLTFVPHLLPMIRGIEATLYARLTPDSQKGMALEDIQALFEARYKDEPFVDVMPLRSHPETRSVKGSNMCRIALHQQENSDTIIVLSVIDNLVKGAAGQAVQNMNIMFGLQETAGIEHIALMP
ncbi:N-acetyl-gamma-glutamyl-phosphate reductase [Alkalimarinus coralli]|uniref:N-acetyl-gamma-glutamyl-phosphate reductase n=1 Tax=Alkalimarinus coralli TaxID=2935863 RepID=UPI00202ACD7F|nr:N-acetyl-gamma-glutamyl-phosphate reductase [Alkalimarinus coralli]